MWVNRKMFDVMAQRVDVVNTSQGENVRLLVENARLRADLDWFKHRLNQVERERGQLIQAAIGVKIAVPEFVPTFNPAEALTEMHDTFKGVGEDDPEHLAPAEDFSAMPGYKG